MKVKTRTTLDKKINKPMDGLWVIAVSLVFIFVIGGIFLDVIVIFLNQFNLWN